MTDIPAIFTGPMVLALLDGRKTETRRGLYSSRKNGRSKTGGEWVPPYRPDVSQFPTGWAPTAWAKAQPGDRIWVRETCRADEGPGGFGVRYKGDDGFIACGAAKEIIEGWPNLLAYHDGSGQWVPGIHMPRWASRLTLIVTATRIERLQDITEEGAEAEAAGTPETAKYRLTRMAYAKLWESINVAASWDANPWVVVLQFQVKRANIDKLGESDGRPEQEAGGQRPEPVRAEP